jgi:hypothetical protein
MLALRFPIGIPGSVPPMPLTDCEPFQWYLVITCKRCRTRQAMHRDTSQGKSALLRSYKWQCVQCHGVATYEAREIERYQHGVERQKKPRP